MNKILVSALVIVALVAIPLFSNATMVRAAPSAISIVPTPRTVSSALSNFTLAIHVDSATNLWMWKAVITWDASVLNVPSSGTSEGPLLATAGSPTLFTVAPIVPGEIREITGEILDTKGANGNGDVAYLTFTFANATKYGNTTISMSNVTMWDPANPHNVITSASADARVFVTLPGDVSSAVTAVPDGVVNMRDIAYMVSKFNTRPASPGWDVNADVNGDGVVNMKDIAVGIANFNRHI